MTEVQQSAVVREGWPLHSIGRRASGDIAYVVPRQPAEIDRLDVQHYALRAALRGNYVAPVEEPSRILDVGSGTGQWGHDLSDEFPDAVVVGLDVVPGKPQPPPNYRYVRANLLQGLPFADDTFDFVHQRLMLSAIPGADWQPLIQEMARVTRPFGLIELAEIGDRMEPRGPATADIWRLAARLGDLYGLDSTGTVVASLDRYLRDAGLVEVERHHVALPMGQWGGEIGSMMASDFRMLFTVLTDVFEARLGVPAAETGELLGAALQECEGYRTNAIIAFVHGRQPGPAGEPS